ncbi:hypothetical protein MPL3356_60001 [Mesorhizobium plurifarium]|uniref:Uncharacterized protein n=1 Tax=Mesorhizobium plurifarium TaxID=69974 RepID=A0A090ECW2_MESPL|nr:hypothetical protein MPL3356_60001 [Mesorhizobium plurifarium]
MILMIADRPGLNNDIRIALSRNPRLRSLTKTFGEPREHHWLVNAAVAVRSSKSSHWERRSRPRRGL